MAESQLIPVFIPALVVLLVDAERRKGSPLTEQEVLAIRDKGGCVTMPVAQAIALDGLKEARALDWRAAVVRVVEHLALVAVRGGEAETAARMLGYGVAFYAEGGRATREFTEMSTYDRLTADLAKALSRDRLAALMAEGARWSEEQAIAVAMRL